MKKLFLALMLLSALAFGRPGIAWYVVKKGDTLSGIAKEYCTTVDELLKLNSFAADVVIKPKQMIKVPGLGMNELIYVFEQIESRGNSKAVGLAGEYGILQLKPIMVDDVNMLLKKYRGDIKNTLLFSPPRRYTYEDRGIVYKSEEMFKIKMWYPTRVQTVREAVKRWNPKSDPKKYIEKYKQVIKK